MVLETRKKLLVTALAALMLVGCGGAEDRKAKYLERGKVYMAEENWDKAGVEIRNVLQIDPKSAEAYYLIGQIEEKRQEWAKAFGNYTKAVELDPELIDARSQLAQFYMLQADALKYQKERDGEAKALGQAQHEIDEILKRDAKHAGARSLQAAILLREGKNDEALALAETVVKEAPTHGPAIGLLAALYIKAGRTADAERVLVEGAAKSDEPLPIKMQLAQLYELGKKNADAERVLRELIAAKPKEHSYRVRLAQFLARTEQTDKAETVLREAIDLNPAEPKQYLMLSQFLAANKGVPAAVDYLRQTIEQKPEMSELRFGLASLYEQNKMSGEALKVYEEVVTHFGEEPPGLMARNRLAELAAAAGDLDKARRLNEQVLKANPKDNAAMLLQGRIAMQGSDFDTAIAAFRSVLKDQPESVELLHLLAEAQLRKGDTELAGDNLRRAVEVAPQNADARIKYARFLIAKRDLANALEQIDMVLVKDSTNADAMAAKSEVLAAKGDLAATKVELIKLKEAAPDNLETYLRLARVLLAEGNAAAAMTEVDSVLKRDEKNLPALILKTDILAATNNMPALEAAINRLKTVAPENPEGYFRMGRFLRTKGDIAGELKEYEQAYSFAQPVAKLVLLSEIVNTQVEAGQADQALARVQAILLEEPEHKAANDLLGVVQMARKEYAAAEAAFSKQIQIDPNRAVFYSQLSAAREQQGNKAGAVAAYEQGLGVLKDDISLLIGLAGVYERQTDFEAAMGVYEKVLAKQADNAIAVNNLAAILADHRTDAQSLARAKELADKLAPMQQPAVRDTMGWVYYRLGDFTKAVEVLEGVVKAEPKVPVFQYHLGMAYAKAGDKVKAKEALSQALALGDFAEAEEARKTLSGL